MAQLRNYAAWLSKPPSFMVLTCFTIYLIALVPNSTVAAPSIFFESAPIAKPLFTQTSLKHSIAFAKLSGVLNGNPLVQSRQGGITNLGPAMIAGDSSSAMLFHNTNIDITGPPEHLSSAVQIDGTRHIRTYGILSGCVICYLTQIKVTPLLGKNTVTASAIDRELNRITGPNAPPFAGLKQSTTKIKPLLLVLDCVFLVLFLLWLVSTALIPTWSIWSLCSALFLKKPALRIEIVRNCPTCTYPTVGLTTQTCPECGNDLPSPREA